MRSLKKVLSLVLALVFVLALATIGASAAYSDNDKITHGDAVATTSALGIFNGYEDGSFNPSGNITRQEACKIIAMALNGGDFDPALYADASIFTDVDGLWGEGYINYLAGQGIVAGMGDGTFNPQGNITAQELAKILLVALGYPSELFTGSNWATYTNRVASSVAVDLYEDYVGAYSKALTREEAALLIYNALLTDCVQATWASTIESMDDLDSWTWKSTGKTFLETYFKAVSYLGFVTATSDNYTELTGTDVVVSYDTDTDLDSGFANNIETTTTYKQFFDIAKVSHYDSLVSKIGSFDGTLGDPVTVYVNTKTKAVVAVAARTIEDTNTESNITYSTTAAVKASAMKTALTSAGFYSGLVNENYTLIASMTGNGTDITFKQMAVSDDHGDYLDIGGITPVKIGGVDFAIYYKINTTFEPYQVTYSSSSYYTLSAYDNNKDVKVYTNTTKNTDAYYNYDTLTKGQWYTLDTAKIIPSITSVIATKYGSCTAITDIEPVDTVTGVGTTSSTTSYNNSTSTVTLDGTAYGLAAIASYVEQSGSVANAKAVYDAAKTPTSSGVTGADLFLDPYGYIFAAVSSEGTAAAVSDYCYIIDADVEASGGNTFGDTDAQVAVLTDDGTYGVYDLAFKYKTTNSTYYSGNYAFVDEDNVAYTTAAQIALALKHHVFSYTISDGVLTIVKAATSGVLVSDYTGYSSTRNADRYITIDATPDVNYTLTNSTELVYMNIATPQSKSTATSVGLGAAQDIDAGETVFYVTDKSNPSYVTKMIAIGEYKVSNKEEYIYLSAATGSYQDDNDDWFFTYEYYSADNADVQTITLKEDYSEFVEGVYALNSDDTLTTTADANVITGKIVDIGDDTIAIKLSNGSTLYRGFDDGVEPILVNDDAIYEVGASVIFSQDSNLAITGLWVTDPAPEA